MEKSKWAATGVIAGAVIGAAAALLLAPKSGRENREALTARSGELRHRASGYMDNIRGRLRRGRNEEAEEVATASSSDNTLNTQD